MLRRIFTIIAVLALASCGEPTESKRSSNNTDNINSIDGSKREILDLKVTTDSGSIAGEEGDFSEKEMLPNLFNQEKKKGRTTIDGKLLTDPLTPDYIDSIEGAEIFIKIDID